jgi:hypothetical protein
MVLWGALQCVLIGVLPIAAGGQAIRLVKRPMAISPDTPVSSLTISASPASVNFGLVAGGTANGSSAVEITTTWGAGFCVFTCTVNLYGYFANASVALSGGSPAVDIPTSEVLGQMPTGAPTTFTAFTQSGPLGGAGASLLLFSQSFTIYTGNGSRTDALNLQINLANQPQLPAGTYSGTLYIVAQSL